MTEKYTKDYDLAQMVLLGNTRAWNTLYNSSYDIVRGYVAKRFINTSTWREPAEDIVSETFKRGYANLSKYQGKSQFSTWVCGIAKNIILETHHKAYKNIELINRISHSYLYNEYMNPERIAILNERDFYIRHAYYSLSAKHRVLIHYIVLMEMSQNKAAKQVGMSVSECAQEYHHAIENLRKKFIYMYYSKDFQKWHSYRD